MLACARFGLDLASPVKISSMEKFVKNISKKMKAVLPEDVLSLLRKIGETAGAMGYRAFLVGGVVRDILLGRKNLDLDIVVEGEGIRVGGALARELDAGLVVHKKFGTCTVSTDKGMKIDFATARREIYPHPAALPDVEPSSIEDDLRRRDFTINAMAVSLNKSSFGRLIDLFEGEEDLKSGRIRVMHDRSFIDDPTRIFRAVRFEARFGFKIDGHTEGLIKDAVRIDMAGKLSGHRRDKELSLVKKEAEPARIIKRIADFKADILWA